MWLTRLALKYPISTLMAAIAALVLGVVSFLQLPVDMLPNIQIPVVTVITYYNGAGPVDMEQSVTVPLERGVSSTNNIDYVQSSTREGVSEIRVFFTWDANVDVGLIDAVQKVNRALSLLPSTNGISQPLVLRYDITSIPVCTVVLSGDMDQRDLYDLAYNIIEPQLEHVSGVASAEVVGGRVREIHIVLDRDRLEALHLPLGQVVQAVAQSNLILPSGDLKSGRYDYSLKTESQFNVVQPMGDVVVTNVNGIAIRLRDLGYIDDAFQEQTEIIHDNGKPGVILNVLKTPGANTVQVVDEVTKALGHLHNVPPSIATQVTLDQSSYIRDSISGLERETIIGAILATIVILIYLRNLRGAVIIFVAIPLSILVTFIFFRFSGTTLNIMTIGGLALGVGRLVDDSIVELEAISRHYVLMLTNGKDKLQSTLEAAREVAAPIFISTVATVIVFLPVVFLTGIAKLLFIPLVITIAVALFSSFFVSRTVAPLLCLHLLVPEKEADPNSRKITERMKIASSKLLDAIDNSYERALRYALSHRNRIIWSIVGLSLVSLTLFKFVGTEFFPDADESEFSLVVKLPVGTRIEVTENFVTNLEAKLKANIPEIQTIISDLGVPTGRSGNLFGENTGTHAANLSVALVSPEKRKRSQAEIMDAVRPLVAGLPGASVFATPGGFLHTLLNFGASAPLDIVISGYAFGPSDSLAKKVFDIVHETPGTADVQITREDNLPELLVVIDRAKAGALGVTVQQIANTVATAISGSIASIFSDPKTGNEYNVLVRLQPNDRREIDDIKKLTVMGASGQLVTLGNIVDVKSQTIPVQIDRKYQQRITEVTANTIGRDLGSVAADINARLAGLSVPPGFTVLLGGNIQQQEQTFRSLLLAFGLAILLVYMVMASQFQSLVDPFIIMFSVPLGIVGVVWMLFLTNTTLSVTSFEGVIVMVGIVVSNGILLVDYVNRLRSEGIALTDAVIQGGRTRLRPIMMTTLATVVGLVPLALGLGGDSSQAPLAIAVIGGLTVSTFLTLIFVPTLYTIFEEKFHWDMTTVEEL